MCGLGLASTAGVQEVTAAPPRVAERHAENHTESHSVQLQEKPVEFSGAPSFLGLSQSPANADYLLDEQPRRGIAFVPVAALLVILVLVGAGWVLREKKPEWVSSEIAQIKTAAATILGSKPSTDTAPAATANDSSSSAPVAAEAKQPESPPPAAASSTPPDDATTEEKPAKPPTAAASVEKIPNDDQSSESAKKEKSDSMVQDGEKYLYGHNVRQDCSRAKSNLMEAADLSNPKAQGILGTMYATGHCVPRDLPTAYRWFTQAKEDGPQDFRIEQDLRLVWKQMTPQQQQQAARSAPR
jgi:hypothetical protein